MNDGGPQRGYERITYRYGRKHKYKKLINLLMKGIKKQQTNQTDEGNCS